MADAATAEVLNAMTEAEKEDLAAIVEQQQQRLKEAPPGAQLPTHLAELHQRVREMITLNKPAASHSHWADRVFYEQTDVKEIANLVLIFFRLEEYHFRVLDTMDKASTKPVGDREPPTRRMRVAADNMGNRNNKDFAHFLRDLMEACKHDIYKIHYTVLGLRMHMESETASVMREEYERLLMLFYDVCSGMFCVKAKDPKAAAAEPRQEPTKEAATDEVKNDVTVGLDDEDDRQYEVQVQMMSDYAFFVTGTEQFEFLKLPACVHHYKKALAYNLVAIKIQRIFESMLRQRNQQKQRFTPEEVKLYIEYQGRFSPFIEEDVIRPNNHVVRLNRIMMEVLHVFGMVCDLQLFEKGHYEVWASDNRKHFISEKMPQFVAKIVVVSQRRRNLKYELTSRFAAKSKNKE